MSVPVELSARLSSPREVDRHQALRELARTRPWQESRPIVQAMRRDPSRLVRFQARTLIDEHKHDADGAAWLPSGRADLLWMAFSFDGRITRWSYWMATLLITVAAWVLSVVGLWLTGPSETALWLLLILNAPFVWANLAIQVKRWHDLDMSGWWILASVVPAAGPLYTFAMLGFHRGTLGPNRFGERGV